MKRFLTLWIFILLSFSQINAQDNHLDSLKIQLLYAKEDTNKVKLLNEIGWHYPWSKPDSALKYGLEALQLAHKLNFSEGEISVSNTLAEAFSTKGNYSKALEICLTTLKDAEKTGKKNIFRAIYIGIGNVYFYSGNYNKALINYKNYQENSSDSIKIIMGFIGEAYYHLNQLDSAFFYINKAYQMDIKEENGYHWSIPYFFMGLINAKRGKYLDALGNYKVGLSYSNNLTLDVTNGYNYIADLFKQTGQVDSAIFYSQKAINLAQKESLTPNVIDASALLTELYGKINIDSAFKYQRIMLAAKDSLFSGEKIRQLQNLSFNEQLRQQEIIKDREQDQARLKLYGLIVLVIVILLIAFILWRNNLHRQKAYELLQRQKQEIDKQKAKLEKTLAELKSTQAQLIQSEKMASLGELTAGIAHEIQNPLNFVNNFSDVNTELIEEMQQEMDKGNLADAKAISNDIRENEQKINLHGKRADAIVKGMLQHSRNSSGVKEPININTLADEYLRLAYHGLRAKDKSFNATLKTDFDQTIGYINIIPQDIGRVILNLITNAFYACSERQRDTTVETRSGASLQNHLTDGETITVETRHALSLQYEPTVSLRTKRTNGWVEVFIRDNGNGISQNVLDKIFQPFFTTKPTGQGTGLGLSMSYDIVKAHGGELKVETVVGEYAEFIIQLPDK